MNNKVYSKFIQDINILLKLHVLILNDLINWYFSNPFENDKIISLWEKNDRKSQFTKCITSCDEA